MKCIRCGHDSKFKERTAGKCPGCRKSFAFERGEAFTDTAFQSAITAVSASGSLRWGVENLYYELARKKRGKPAPLGCLVPALLPMLGALVLVDAPALFRVFLLLVGGIFVAIFAATRFRRTVRLHRSEFDKLWQHWLAVHGKPEGVIERPTAPKEPRRREPDLGDYSFDRAVICDRSRTVDLLLANRFHFENNCAVLSITGYPQGPFETVREMLKRNPKLKVFALHDASPEGCRMAHTLATDPQWFKGSAEVIDVGLRPGNDGSAFRALRLVSGASVQPGHGISDEEARWLSRYTLELAAIRPEQILKRLFRAITRKEDAPADKRPADTDTDTDGSWSSDTRSFSSDASGSEGSADGFG